LRYPAGGRCPEGAHDPRQEVDPRRRTGVDDQRPLPEAVELVEGATAVGDRGRDPRRVGFEHPARFAEERDAPLAHEEAMAQLLLELADVLGECRLRQMDALGG
jgi:hypothetical protein